MSSPQLHVVFHLTRLFGRFTSKTKFKLQQAFEEVRCKLKAFTGVLNGKDEAADSARIFYLLSVVLLISLVMLSPDKILQGEVPSQMSEKAQDIWKLIRKLGP